MPEKPRLWKSTLRGHAYIGTLRTRRNAATLQTSHKDRTHRLLDQSRIVSPYHSEAMDRRSVYSRSVLAPDPDASEDSRSQVQAYLREFVLEFRLDNAFIYRYELYSKSQELLLIVLQRSTS